MFALRNLYETAGNIQWDGRKGLHWINDNLLASKSMFIRNQLDKNKSEVGETLLCNVESDTSVKKLPSDICSMTSLRNQLAVGTANGTVALYSEDGEVDTKKLSLESVSFLHESDNRLIAAYEDGSIDILDTDLSVIKKLTDGSTEDLFAVATNSRYLVVGGEDSILRFYHLNSDNLRPIKVCRVINYGIDYTV